MVEGQKAPVPLKGIKHSVVQEAPLLHQLPEQCTCTTTDQEQLPGYELEVGLRKSGIKPLSQTPFQINQFIRIQIGTTTGMTPSKPVHMGDRGLKMTTATFTNVIRLVTAIRRRH